MAYDYYGKITVDAVDSSGNKFTENLGYIHGNVAANDTLAAAALTFTRSVITSLTLATYNKSDVTYEVNLDDLEE